MNTTLTDIRSPNFSVTRVKYCIHVKKRLSKLMSLKSLMAGCFPLAKSLLRSQRTMLLLRYYRKEELFMAAGLAVRTPLSLSPSSCFQEEGVLRQAHLFSHLANRSASLALGIKQEARTTGERDSGCTTKMPWAMMHRSLIRFISPYRSFSALTGRPAPARVCFSLRPASRRWTLERKAPSTGLWMFWAGLSVIS